MSSLSKDFILVQASLPGREHARVHRNNQDAGAGLLQDGLAILAVADGCSSGASSEVGARLGVAWLVRRLPTLWEACEGVPDRLMEATCAGLLAYLEAVGRPLARGEGEWPLIVQDHLLFTFLVAVVSAETTLVFGVGDGVVSLNGQVQTLEAEADNCPPYLAYRLLPGAVPENLTRCRLHLQVPTAEVDRLLVATDGAAELERRRAETLRDGTPVPSLDLLCHDPRLFWNQSLMQKRLNVIGDLNGKLGDDTTIALLARRPEAQAEAETLEH